MLRAGQSIQININIEEIYKLLSKYTTIHSGLDKVFCIKYSPISNKSGEIMGYISLIEDKTEEHKLLYDLTEAKNKAEESDKLKMAFLANMSHEIRTPLNAIVGFTDLMQYTDDPIEQNEYKSIIHTNTELLLRLINDVLDLSKIESGLIDLRPERFDFAVAFTKTYTMFSNKNQNSNVQIIEENPFSRCTVFLDRTRILQILNNFMTNAIKHTNKGSITMGYRLEDEGIKVYVKDTGNGIPKKMENLIFMRFRKLDPFVQGIGLGLAICKAIVERVDGRIGFDSEEGVGTTFWAWMPCQPQVTLRKLESETEAV